MAAMRDLGPVLGFMQTLWALDHALQSASKRMEKTLGVTAPQRLVIRILGRFPRLSAGEVSEILRVHPSTLTGILKRLEERRLVVRRADPVDGRRALLELTGAGREIDRARSGTVEAAVRQALQRTPPASVRSVRGAALSLVKELEKLGR